MRVRTRACMRACARAMLLALSASPPAVKTLDGICSPVHHHPRGLRSIPRASISLADRQRRVAGWRIVAPRRADRAPWRAWLDGRAARVAVFVMGGELHRSYSPARCRSNAVTLVKMRRHPAHTDFCILAQAFYVKRGASLTPAPRRCYPSPISNDRLSTSLITATAPMPYAVMSAALNLSPASSSRRAMSASRKAPASSPVM